MDVQEHGLYIAAKSAPSSSGATAEVLDPATNRPIARVASGTKDDVDSAVEAARRAFELPEWRDLDPSKRGRLLWLLGQQIRDHFEDLARLESLNVGKPIREAKGDIAYVYKLFEYYAGLADKIQGDTIPVPGARLDYTMREPLGVTAHIAPWNYPLLLASRGIAPALAAGNTVVLKPATLTPLTALRLGELAAASGFPPGVVNVVTGPGRQVGEALANHRDVDSVTFTGSTDTGKQLLRIVADRVVPTTLELGGKNPQIILADARLDRAVKGALWGAFQNAGQMCWAGSKLLVHESIASTLLAKLKEQAEKLRLGPGTKEEVQMGPLVSREHAANVTKAIDDGISKGSKVLTGGRRPESADLAAGNFLQPTIFQDPPEGARVAREEVFGPVLAAWSFADLDEAIARANDTPYGLSAGVWTQDVSRAHALARRLKAGMVSINEYPVTFPQTPFLGWKQSGLGSEQGADAVLFYTHVKNVLVNLE
ncbi:MAG TPA: aldehyde dehydrogenase family protein [Thermoplasmata archaeon]|nr:aldehyde dehydrogenase family protein [Thermoplasmata archaeon]